jgi:hypothetical protein
VTFFSADTKIKFLAVFPEQSVIVQFKKHPAKVSHRLEIKLAVGLYPEQGELLITDTLFWQLAV